jgi:hypothetical protein
MSGMQGQQQRLILVTCEHPIYSACAKAAKAAKATGQCPVCQAVLLSVKALVYV